MSTALTANHGSLSAFYDVNEVLLQTLQQSRKLSSRSQAQLTGQCPEARRAPGMPTTNQSQQHYRAFSPPTTHQQGKLSPNSTNDLISFSEASLISNIVREQAQNQMMNLNRRSLERCMSEPGDRNANRAAAQELVNQERNPVNINSSRYKTEMCRPFEENGHCKYGDKCQFAHGMPELKSLNRHPKYKTELCRTFHTIGFCPYGPRCHFIHNEDEHRLNQINMLKQREPPSPTHQMSRSQQQPGPVQRPRVQGNVEYGRPMSLPIAMQREPLGSTADSPQSSYTSSPTLSPTMFSQSEDIFNSSMGSSTFSPPPPTSAPPPGLHHRMPQNVFHFPISTMEPQSPLTAPLNINTDTLAQLAAGLQAVSLQNGGNTFNSYPEVHYRDLDSFPSQYSPPDSISGDSSSSGSTCESPLDVSRNLRLPIFSRIADC